MICKNCKHTISEDMHYCENCGAKVIRRRTTLKALIQDILKNVFDLDGSFLTTMRMLAIKPHVVLQEYLDGVRKKYMNPFAFIALAAGISLVVFNVFREDYQVMERRVQAEAIQELESIANLDIDSMHELSDDEAEKLRLEQQSAKFQLKFSQATSNFLLNYYNLMAFFFMIAYALLSKWTFQKPHNFGEHLVMNAYAYGFSTYITLVLFLISLVSSPIFYLISMLISFLYYFFMYKKLYALNWSKMILKTLRFLVGLTAFAIFAIIGVLIISFTLNKYNVI